MLRRKHVAKYRVPVPEMPQSTPMRALTDRSRQKPLTVAEQQRSCSSVRCHSLLVYSFEVPHGLVAHTQVGTASVQVLAILQTMSRAQVLPNHSMRRRPRTYSPVSVRVPRLHTGKGNETRTCILEIEGGQARTGADFWSCMEYYCRVRAPIAELAAEHRLQN